MDEPFTRCASAVTVFLTNLTPIYRDKGFAPISPSQAANELTSTTYKELLETAYGQSGMLIEVATDVTTAYAKTLTNPIQTIAPWTLARSILESSSLALWLLDSSIAVNVRLQRSFAIRYEGLVEQSKFARSIKQNELVESARKRILEVERKATDAGFPPLRDKNGKLNGIGVLMPRVTELIGQMLDREWLYRVLSGAAHCHFWALKHLSFELVDVEPNTIIRTAISGVQIHPMQKGLSPINVLGLSAEVLRALTMAIWARSCLFGFDSSSLTPLFEEVFNTLGVTNERLRFWRPRNPNKDP
jgi:hypothetical protein